MVLQATLAIPQDQRTAARRAVDFRAFVRESKASVVPVAVIDVSTDGCRFKANEAFETATVVWLKIDGLGARQARIIWRHEAEHGCEFVAPVQSRTMDEVCAAAGLA